VGADQLAVGLDLVEGCGNLAGQREGQVLVLPDEGARGPGPQHQGSDRHLPEIQRHGQDAADARAGRWQPRGSGVLQQEGQGISADDPGQGVRGGRLLGPPDQAVLSGHQDEQVVGKDPRQKVGQVLQQRLRLRACHQVAHGLQDLFQPADALLQALMGLPVVDPISFGFLQPCAGLQGQGRLGGHQTQEAFMEGAEGLSHAGPDVQHSVSRDRYGQARTFQRQGAPGLVVGAGPRQVRRAPGPLDHRFLQAQQRPRGQPVCLQALPGHGNQGFPLGHEDHGGTTGNQTANHLQGRLPRPHRVGTAGQGAGQGFHQGVIVDLRGQFSSRLPLGHLGLAQSLAGPFQPPLEAAPFFQANPGGDRPAFVGHGREDDGQGEQGPGSILAEEGGQGSEAGEGCQRGSQALASEAPGQPVRVLAGRQELTRNHHDPEEPGRRAGQDGGEPDPERAQRRTRAGGLQDPKGGQPGGQGKEFGETFAEAMPRLSGPSDQASHQQGTCRAQGGRGRTRRRQQGQGEPEGRAGAEEAEARHLDRQHLGQESAQGQSHQEPVRGGGHGPRREPQGQGQQDRAGQAQQDHEPGSVGGFHVRPSRVRW